MKKKMRSWRVAAIRYVRKFLSRAKISREIRIATMHTLQSPPNGYYILISAILHYVRNVI